MKDHWHIWIAEKDYINHVFTHISYISWHIKFYEQQPSWIPAKVLFGSSASKLDYNSQESRDVCIKKFNISSIMQNNDKCTKVPIPVLSKAGHADLCNDFCWTITKVQTRTRLCIIKKFGKWQLLTDTNILILFPKLVTREKLITWEHDDLEWP